jgi:acetate kinase
MPAQALSVLSLNSGSSSLKFGLYRVGPSGAETLLSEVAPTLDAKQALQGITVRLAQPGLPAVQAIGHRVVHGGPNLRQHGPIDDTLLQQLEHATAFAPLHVPAALALIRAAQQHFPGLPQVACFDTSFHAGLPDVARVLPIAREWQARGIQRYGFHGLSCESIVQQLADRLPERLVIAHLGNGASVTAVKGGRSIDTSMGLTPGGGTIMGTRSGDLDPGLLVYLLREQGFDAESLDDLVNRRSGLRGISGVGSDMRELHASARDNADARLAIEMFCHSVRKQVAGMIAVLGGVDRIVFTGGIGENDAAVRETICGGMSWAGVSADTVLVLPSREDEQIARHTWAASAQGRE